MKTQRKDAGGRKSLQHPNLPQPKPLPVQSAVESVHQESDSIANKHARTDHQFSQNPCLQAVSQQQHSLLEWHLFLMDGEIIAGGHNDMNADCILSSGKQDHTS